MLELRTHAWYNEVKSISNCGWKNESSRSIAGKMYLVCKYK